MNRRILAAALAAPALAAAVAVAGAPSASAQTTTGFYCSGPIAVPGTYGNFQNCTSFVLSKNSAGQGVVTPYLCRIINNTGTNVNWYRAAWTHANGYIYTQTSYGTQTPGTWTKNCTDALLFWLVRGGGEYVRDSVQAAGSSQTAGANVVAP